MKAGLADQALAPIVVRIAVLAVAVIVAVWVFNDDRGVPLAVLILMGFVLGMQYVVGRTRFGRHVFAVGGNAEAARRAGINVNRVRVIVFSIASAMAAIGGILAASRLLAVNQSSGASDLLLLAIAGPVIAGTSLFGGRGSVWSALLGALIIGSISNGMDLLALESSVKFMVTGGVLLAAVIVDALARQAAPGGRESLTREIPAHGAGRLRAGRRRAARAADRPHRRDGGGRGGHLRPGPPRGGRHATTRARRCWTAPTPSGTSPRGSTSSWWPRPTAPTPSWPSARCGRGCAVVVDKPLAVSAADAERLVARSRARQGCRWPCSTTAAGTATSWLCASWRRHRAARAAARRAGSAGGPQVDGDVGASRTPTPTAAACCGIWAAT